MQKMMRVGNHKKLMRQMKATKGRGGLTGMQSCN